MQIRDWMSDNQPIVAGVAILILILSFGYMTCTLVGGPGGGSYTNINEFFFYDTNTGELFVESINAVPPIPAPSDIEQNTGRLSGVRAYVFSCTDCSDRSSHEIRYLQRYTPRGKKMLEQYQDGQESDLIMMSPESDSEIKRPGDEAWHPVMSPMAQEIFDEVYRECENGKRPAECFPQD